jgi:LmbE family N-acetylglucosaminyl deacetylase
MIGFQIEQVKRALFLVAHPDDVEIGCFHLLTTLLKRDVTCRVVVCSGTEGRRKEQKESVRDLDLYGPEKLQLLMGQFSDGLFPQQLEGIKNFVREKTNEFEPDIIVTHYRADSHQDHRTLGGLAYNIFRNQPILECEIAKYDVDTGTPNVFLPMNNDALEAKTKHLLAHFASQQEKGWYTANTFAAIARIRGIQCNSVYAEAYYCSKLVLEL